MLRQPIMKYEKLYQEAINVQRNGILDLSKDEKDYAFTFIYPPSQVLYKIDETIMGEEVVENANIYIHIPFCTGKCNYCYFGCYHLAKSPVSKKEYIENLIREIQMVSQKYGKVNVQSLHFGGGTPTILDNSDFVKIFKQLRESFFIDDGIEITCESSPETLTNSKLEILISLGVNRLNIGIQTLNDSLLASINRRHNSEQALNAIKKAKDMGIKNINVDLMYGLEGQSCEDWKDTLERIANMNLQSISTYRLRIHPSGKIKHQISQFDEEKMIEMYVKLMEIMDIYSYIQSSSHKFALKEELVQKQIINKRGIGNNKLLAFGMAAYGYIGNVLYWNDRNIQDYCNKVKSGILPYSVGYKLDKVEEMAKVCVLGIHNIHGIDLKKFKETFNVELSEVYGELLRQLLENKLIVVDEKYMRPSKLGMVFADEIATKFYSDSIREKLKNLNKRYGIFFDEIIY